MLRFDRKQQNSVKQLYFNKKKTKTKLKKEWKKTPKTSSVDEDILELKLTHIAEINLK